MIALRAGIFGASTLARSLGGGRRIPEAGPDLLAQDCSELDYRTVRVRSCARAADPRPPDRLADDEHVLVLTMHHIVSDGWSMGVLVNELSTLYGAFREGSADPLPPLAVQYPDYAHWQRQWLSGEPVAAGAGAVLAQDTWPARRHLLELPADRPPARRNKAIAGAMCRFRARRRPDGRRLKALGAAHGVTLFMTLLSGWAALLSRLSGQKEVVIGSPSANRGRREIEGLIGFFVNTLALRIDLSGDPSVAELLRQAWSGRARRLGPSGPALRAGGGDRAAAAQPRAHAAVPGDVRLAEQRRWRPRSAWPALSSRSTDSPARPSST